MITARFRTGKSLLLALAFAASATAAFANINAGFTVSITRPVEFRNPKIGQPIDTRIST